MGLKQTKLNSISKLCKFKDDFMVPEASELHLSKQEQKFTLDQEQINTHNDITLPGEVYMSTIKQH